MDIAQLKESYKQQWQAAKQRLDAANQAVRQATVDGLRIEGALKALAELEQANGVD